MSSNFFQNIRIVYATNKNFRDDIKYIRENVPIITFFAPGAEMEEKFEEAKSSKPSIIVKTSADIQRLMDNYSKAVSGLRLKYNLSSSYQEPLKDFIEVEDRSYLFNIPAELWPFNIANPTNPQEEFTVIRLNPETTITELQKNWSRIRKEVAELSAHKPLKASPRTNIGRDLEIYQLRQAGKEYKEIDSIINEKYSDKTLGYQDIAKIIKRLLDYSKKLTGQAK